MSQLDVEAVSYTPYVKHGSGATYSNTRPCILLEVATLT